MLGVQVTGLGHEPAVQLPPRDTRAQEVEGFEPATSTSTSSSSQAACISGGIQQDPCMEQATCSSQQQCTEVVQQQAGAGQDSGGVTGSVATAALQGVHEALQEELAQLRSSYLLLQEEYWRQKERLLALELDSAQLKAAAEKAADTAVQVGLRILALSCPSQVPTWLQYDAQHRIHGILTALPCITAAVMALTHASQPLQLSQFDSVNVCRRLQSCRLCSSKRPRKQLKGPDWKLTWLAAGHGSGSWKRLSSSTSKRSGGRSASASMHMSPGS
jgi:hypothetical protein